MMPKTAASSAKRKTARPKRQTFVDTPKGERLLIGVAERVDLPQWGITNLKAKIDTGARSSAVHVEDIELVDRSHIRFSIPRDDGRNRWVTAKFSRRASVRSSTGKEQMRYFVTTELVLAGHRTEIEVSLTSRGAMKYPMLLGRTAMKGLVIDPSRRYVATRLHLDSEAKKRNATKADAIAATKRPMKKTAAKPAKSSPAKTSARSPRKSSRRSALD